MGENHELLIGRAKKKNFSISYEMRMQNMVVYGIKGSGKTKYILPMLAQEQLENKDEGATFIVEKQEMGWFIRELAHKHNREIIFLNPSEHDGMKELITKGMTTESEIKEKVVDYEDAMLKKKIVIIDAEPYKYHNNASQAVKKLLYYLQSTLYKNSPKTPHLVYIDDAEQYLPNIESLLIYGEQFGIGTTLFMQSHSIIQSKSKQLILFMDANIRTTILANGLLDSDYKFFNDRFFGEDMDESSMMLQRKYNMLLIETIIKGSKSVETVEVKYLPEKICYEIRDEIDVRKAKALELLKQESEAKCVLPEPENTPEEIICLPEKKKLAKKTNAKKTFKPAMQTEKIFVDEMDFDTDF